MLLVASCSDRGAGSKMSALHSPVNHRAVLRGLAGQLLGFEVQKRVIMSANITTSNMEPKQRGEAEGQVVKKSKRKQGGVYTGQKNKNRGKEDRGSREGGEEMITTNHSKRTQHRHSHIRSRVPFKHKLTCSSDGCHSGTGLSVLTDWLKVLVSSSCKILSKALHLPKTGQTEHMKRLKPSNLNNSAERSALPFLPLGSQMEKQRARQLKARPPSQWGQLGGGSQCERLVKSPAFQERSSSLYSWPFSWTKNCLLKLEQAG